MRSEKSAIAARWQGSDRKKTPPEVATFASQAIENADAELTRLRRALGQARAEIAALRLLADHDPLTGLPNRRRLMAEIALAIEQRKRGLPAVFVFVDMDGLKRLNDRHGHRTGDAAIVAVARAIRDSLGDGFAARLGGDEFALILHGMDVETGARRLQQIARRMTATPLWIDGHRHMLSVSAGITAIAAGDRPATLIARADAVMYAQKRHNQEAARSAR